MDERTKSLIENGCPVVVVHFNPKDGEILSEEEFNMQNLKIEDWQVESLAHVLYPAMMEDLSDPERMKEFEKWKEEHDNQEGLADV